MRAAMLLLLVLACTPGCTVDRAPMHDDDAGAIPVDATCTTTCEGNVALACNGSHTTCEHACVGALGCVLCRPSMAFCDDDGVPRMCASDGASSEALPACADDEICQAGACANLCSATDDDRPSTGCEFLAVPTLNSMLGGGAISESNLQTLGSDGFHFAIAVANPHPVPVTVHVTRMGTDITRRVAGGGVETILLPWIPTISQVGVGGIPLTSTYAPFRGSPSVLAPNGGYVVSANAPVVVYQFNPLNYADDAPAHASFCGGGAPGCFSYSNDASLLLPTHGLGTHYTVVTYGTQYRIELCPSPSYPAGVYDAPGGFITIVASADDTHVTVHPTARLRAGPSIDATEAGAPLARTLARGDVMQVVADRLRDDECQPAQADSCEAACTTIPDLTGTTVDSDQPIAVFAGHDCAQVPVDVIACDHLEDQLWPDQALGHDYALVPLYAPTVPLVPTLARIVAIADDTHVTLDPPAAGVSTLTLQRGEHAELEIYTPTLVHGDQPLVAAEFMVGQQRSMRDSDPSLVIAVPREQWRTDYPVLVPATYTSSFVSIAAPTDSDIRIDGVTQTPTTRVTALDFYLVTIQPGQHLFTSGEPFTVLVSGQGPYVSYAYPGGGNVRRLF